MTKSKTKSKTKSNDEILLEKANVKKRSLDEQSSPTHQKQQPKTKRSRIDLRKDFTLPLNYHKQRLLSIYYGWDSLPFDNNDETVKDLHLIIEGSVKRGEGNSALVVGGRGSGKSLAIQTSLSMSNNDRFIPIHLHGSIQTNDKMALREMARQIRDQGGTVSSLDMLDENEDNTIDIAQSTLTALLTLLSASALPIVVILNEFDLFATHARQALLYCLLDCAQGGQRRGGLAVIGTTTRYNAIEMLEKRVKSRFSQRILHISRPRNWTEWSSLAKRALECEYKDDIPNMKEFKVMWDIRLKELFKDPQFDIILKMIYDLLADVQSLYKIFAIPIANLTTSHMFPQSHEFLSASLSQRPCDTFQILDTLPLPALSLVIAARHLYSRDIDQFTFELVNKEYDEWARKTLLAPVNSSSDVLNTNVPKISVSVWPRHVLMGAFDTLVNLAIFVPVSSANAIASGEMREYCKYRCTLDGGDVKTAVERRKDLPTSIHRWGTTWH